MIITEGILAEIKRHNFSQVVSGRKKGVVVTEVENLFDALPMDRIFKVNSILNDPKNSSKKIIISNIFTKFSKEKKLRKLSRGVYAKLSNYDMIPYDTLSEFLRTEISSEEFNNFTSVQKLKAYESPKNSKEIAKISEEKKITKTVEWFLDYNKEENSSFLNQILSIKRDDNIINYEDIYSLMMGMNTLQLASKIGQLTKTNIIRKIKNKVYSLNDRELWRIKNYEPVPSEEIHI
jgi:hypothetical protein